MAYYRLDSLKIEDFYMKRLVLAFLSALMVASPTLANPYSQYRYENHENEYRQDRRSRDILTGAIIGGLVVGILSSESRKHHEPDIRYYDRRYIPPVRQICQTEYVRDFRGNIAVDYYGRPLIVEKCWYQ